MKTVQINIRIPEATHDKMKFDVQRRTGKTITEQVNEAIESYLKPVKK